MQQKKISFLLGFLFCCFLTISFAENAPSSDDASFTLEQEKVIDQKIEAYIRKHPRAVVDALIAYRQQEMQKRELQVQKTIKAHDKTIFSADATTVLGNPQGHVTVVEFLDYQCKHCRDMSSVLDKLIQQDTDVRVIVRELPIFGGASLFAAKAALAAGNQDKFAQMHEALIDAPLPLTKEKIVALARGLRLDIAQFKKDMNAKMVDRQIKDNFELSQKLRIMGTPAFIVGKIDSEQVFFIPGATTLDRLRSMVDKIRSE